MSSDRRVCHAFVMNDPVAALNLEPGQYLSRAGLEGLLNRLSPSAETESSSVYLRPPDIDRFLGTKDTNEQRWAAHFNRIGDAVVESGTGVVGLQSGDRALVVIPPFPILENKLLPQWDAAPLLQLVAAEYTIGVVLLRLGRFSVAVFHGEKLVSSKTDARFVKGRHRKGGSSQRRFERIREGQMRSIYDKTCETVRAQFEPVARDIDYVALGGERLTLNGFLRVCPHMEQFQNRLLPRRLNVRDPKRDTLEAVGQMLTESRVYSVLW